MLAGIKSQLSQQIEDKQNELEQLRAEAAESKKAAEDSQSQLLEAMNNLEESQKKENELNVKYENY